MHTRSDLFPETLLVSRDYRRVYTTSLKVAEHFGKRHKDVLRSIKRLLAEMGEVHPKLDAGEPNFGLSDRFTERDFALSEYADSSGRTLPMYEMTEEGFALLAMGFTGREALYWKMQFLDAFRQMEREVHRLREREAQALYFLRPRWRPILRNPGKSRQELIQLTGHKSPASITACRRRMREAGLLGEENA